MIRFLATFLIICTIIVAGCTMEKRLYRKGWYIAPRKEWRSASKEVQSKNEMALKNDPQRHVASGSILDTQRLDVPTSADSFMVTEKSEFPEFLAQKSSVKTNYAPKKMSRRITLHRTDKSEDPPKEKSVNTFAISLVIVLLIVFTIMMIVISFSLGSLPQGVLAAMWLIGMAILAGVGFSLNRKREKNEEKGDVVFEEITGEALNEVKHERKRKALFFTIFILILLATSVWIATGTIFFVEIILVAGISLLFALVILWAEYLRIRKADTLKIKKKKSIVEPPIVEIPSDEEIRRRQKKRIRRAIFMQVFLLVFFIILYLIIFFTTTPTVNGIILLLTYFLFFSFFNWQPTIYKNKHPELERVEKVQPEFSQETESVEEIDPLIKMAARIKQLKRMIAFSAFGSVALFLVALVALNAFMWVFFGVFMLMTVITLFEHYRLKKKMQTEAS